MTLALGARLGPYEIVGPLGKGGMGEVYRARDTRLGRDVAVKVLPAATAADAETRARFEYEARAVASLNHPNILALYDVGDDSGVSYAVAELLDGETLRERLAREGPLAPGRVLDLAVQFARGLAAAHARGIVHRDLKPDNLFITADGRLKILDFGIARPDASARVAHDAETRVATEPGLLLGTASYMAPEQIRGEAASARADIFSYGLVLREALTGSNPFSRGTTADTLAAILRDDPDPLPALPGFPPLAAALLDRCLVKRPEARPESVGDLAIVLEAIAAHGSAPGVDVPVLPGRGLVRRAASAAAALAALLSLALAMYVGWSVERAARDSVAGDFARADTLVRRAHQDRLERLQLHARVTAALPTLKALFDTDAPTIRDYLQSYQQRTPGAPLLIALGQGGHLLAGTGTAALPPDESPQWLVDLAAAGGAATITIGGVPHHAAVAHAEAGGTIFGSVVAAAPLDDGFAQVLRDILEAETALLDAQTVTGTSLRAAQVPWRSLAEFRDAGGLGGVPLDVAVGATRYMAWGVALSETPAVAAVVLASPQEAAHYRGIQAGMVGLGLAVAAAILLAGWIYSRRAFPPDQRSL